MNFENDAPRSQNGALPVAMDGFHSCSVAEIVVGLIISKEGKSPPLAAHAEFSLGMIGRGLLNVFARGCIYLSEYIEGISPANSNFESFVFLAEGKTRLVSIVGTR